MKYYLRLLFTFITIYSSIGILLIMSNSPVFADLSSVNPKTNYIIVDFSKPNYEKRFFIYDENGYLVFSTYVAHGYGSGRTYIPTKFSNQVGSHASSLGKYKLVSYFAGVHGKSIKLIGLDSTNNNAYKRAIEIHPAYYVSSEHVGYSAGCFAIPVKDVSTVYNLISIGSYLYAKN